MNFMKITEEQQKQINKIGERYDLFLIVLYGSAAKGLLRKGSDIDVAVLGNKKITFEQIVDLINEFTDVFEREVDAKSLHNTNPLFRYQVMKDGVLLYGNQHQFNKFKLYCIRVYQENQKLRNLRDLLLKKRQKHLEELYGR